MNTNPRSRARGVRLGAAAILLAALLAIAGGAARTGSAASASVLTVSATQQPATTATLSSASGCPGGACYVFYSVQVQSDAASWSHVTLSDAPTVTPSGSGAAVVFVDHPDICTFPTASGGFTCNIDKLPGNTALTFNVVVRTPTSGSTLAVNPTVIGDETANDNPNANHAEVFTVTPPPPPSWTLTSDTTNALTSYTNPATTTGTASFFTNKTLCGSSTCATKNPQWTQADVPNGVASLGTLVSLSERNLSSGECPSLVTSAGLHCFPQVSQISVGASGSYTSSPLGFTVRVAATSLTFKVNLKKALVFHDPATLTSTGYEKVPFCSTGNTDSVGDCTVSVVQDTLTHDIVYQVRGPSNGTFGGAG